MFREEICVLGKVSNIGKSFKNGMKITDGNLLLKQILQYFLNDAEGHNIWHQFFHDFRFCLRMGIQQFLGFLPANEFKGMVFQYFCNMGR